MITLTAGYLLKRSLSGVLPFVWCGLILVLYALSFGRILNCIDVIMPVVAMILFCAAIFVSVEKAEKTALSSNRSGAASSGAGGRTCRYAVSFRPEEIRDRLALITAYLKDNVPEAGFVAYLTLCILLPITLHARTVTWWDDINFWATDLKSLYYLGGFAHKYTNVSPQFGDYPPGVQLAKWFLVHMDRSAFREDLAFVGYYLFNLSFVMQIFKRIKGRASLLGIPLALIAWAFAGIGEIYGYSGFCADLSMAYLFGSVLICATENMTCVTSANRSICDSIYPALYLAVLVITKSTGFIWTFFGVVIWVVTYLLGSSVKVQTEGETHSAKNKKKDDGIERSSGNNSVREKIPRIITVCAAPLLTGASWMLFCLRNHRVAQTTSTMVTYMTTDDYGLSAYKSDFASAFLKGFFLEPLHLDHTWIDLPAAGIFILIVILLVLFRKKGYLSGRSGLFMCIFLPVMGLIYYVVIFCAHLTMFATETQYLEASAMAASIERYGAPFVMGTMLCLAYIWMGNCGCTEVSVSSTGDKLSPTDPVVKDPDQKTGITLFSRTWIFVIAVIALTNIPAAFNGFIGYMKNDDVDQANEMRADMIDDESSAFLQVIEGSGITDRCISEGGLRICRVRDGAYYRVADTYVAYEASPVSVMAPSVKLSDIDGNIFVQMVNETHAEYVYVDEQPQIPVYLDEMVKSDSFGENSDDLLKTDQSGEQTDNVGQTNGPVNTDNMAQSGTFEYNRIYRISYEDGMMKLTACK